MLGVADGALSSLRLDEQSTFQASPLAQKGDLGPASPADAVVLGAGKILSADGSKAYFVGAMTWLGAPRR